MFSLWWLCCVWLVVGISGVAVAGEQQNGSRSIKIETLLSPPT